jgi:hypothetical protein
VEDSCVYSEFQKRLSVFCVSLSFIRCTSRAVPWPNILNFTDANISPQHSHPELMEDLFTYYSYIFNNTLSISGYITSNGKVILNN